MSRLVQVKSPIFALFLSAILPGAGQLYNGDAKAGIIYIILTLISIPLFFIVIGYITYSIIWFIAVYTAYTGAQKVNRAFMGQAQQGKIEKLD